MSEETVQTVVVENFRDATHLLEKESAYLKLIGAHYGCQVAGRGNVIRISGEAEAVTKAGRMVEELLRMIRGRIALSEQHVKQALRLFDEGNEGVIQELEADTVNVTKNGSAIHPRTPGQKRYVDAIRHHAVTFGVGPAGTGKTFLAVALAAFYLRNHDVERIILVRPAVEAGERLGFLPGDLQEKVNPYLRPLFDGLLAMLGAEELLHLQQKGAVEVAPLAYMRGRTLEKSFVILDEAQNTTIEQMKMFLTRLGFRSKMVINGDVTQIDLPPHVRSGLIDAVRVLQDVPDIARVTFGEEDVVRHDLVAAIVHAYEEDRKKREIRRMERESKGEHDGNHDQLQ